MDANTAKQFDRIHRRLRKLEDYVERLEASAAGILKDLKERKEAREREAKRGMEIVYDPKGLKEAMDNLGITTTTQTQETASDPASSRCPRRWWWPIKK